jgi:hypothetical protein
LFYLPLTIPCPPTPLLYVSYSPSLLHNFSPILSSPLLFSSFSFTASKLCVSPKQLTLYCGPTGDDPKHISPVLTVGKEDQMVKFYDINNRKAFKLTDYTIHYSILPFPVFNADGIDLRFERKGSMRFIELYICDSRLRSWRQLYLDHLAKSKEDSTVRLDGETSAADRKKRKTVNLEGGGSVLANAPSAGAEEDEYSWPELAPGHTVATEHMVCNKVCVMEIYDYALQRSL